MIRQRFFSLIGFQCHIHVAAQEVGHPRRGASAAGSVSRAPAGARPGHGDVESRPDGREQVLQQRREKAYREGSCSTEREHPARRVGRSPLARVEGPVGPGAGDALGRGGGTRSARVPLPPQDGLGS